MRRKADVRGPAPLLRPGCFVIVGMVLLTGCHHRRPVTVVLPAQTAVPVEPVASPADTAELEPTKTKLPPVPVASGAVRPKKMKRPKKSQAAAQPAAATVPAAQAKKPEGSATEEPAVSIGSLTVSGDQSPQVRQEAMDLLAANERRLAALPADVQRLQAALVSKARTFQRDAQQALGSGDAAGAKTLAMKGKLLLDDLEQGNAPK